jgi:hypothetical protein
VQDLDRALDRGEIVLGQLFDRLRQPALADTIPVQQKIEATFTRSPEVG